MSNLIISVENISKKYIIGENLHGSGARTFRDIFDHKMKQMFSKEERKHRKEETTLWALKDISFDVNQGDVVGIIGRNGAGKSTLLKILSRITEPTTGRIKLKGRVASLLEVGTGFNQELTGRENIYLNGSILGMRKFEINKKFNEIVAFSEIEKFLDTPVKRYSSGMYVRLAFAVAAHLEPEILIIDEVLAVGDLEFQKKCLGKMKDVSKEGRTVLFVSHNLGAVAQLCSKAILLNKGNLINYGKSSETIQNYISKSSIQQKYNDLSNYKLREGTQDIYFLNAGILNKDGNNCSEFCIGDDIIVEFTLKRNSTSLNEIKIGIEICNAEGIQLCNVINIDSNFIITKLDKIEKFSVTFPDVRFYPNSYSIDLWTGDKSASETLDYIKGCLSFHIIDGGKLTTRTLTKTGGIFFLTPYWRRDLNVDVNY